MILDDITDLIALPACLGVSCKPLGSLFEYPPNTLASPPIFFAIPKSYPCHRKISGYPGRLRAPPTSRNLLHALEPPWTLLLMLPNPPWLVHHCVAPQSYWAQCSILGTTNALQRGVPALSAPLLVPLWDVQSLDAVITNHNV